MEQRATPLRILIVDDAPVVREALRWMLGEVFAGPLVSEAKNGHEALTLVAELAPDVVILDIELPDSDGYTVARSLKALPNAPLVLFLSVHDDVYAKYQAAAAGGDGFVEKALGWPPLIEEVRRLLTNRQVDQ
ncbi:MAG: response regulator transcription factor [Caldilineaceae bacterium]